MQTKSNAVCAGTWCESYSKGELGLIKLKKNLHYLPTDLPITFHHPSIQLPASIQMIGKLIGKIFLLNPGLSLYMALIFKRPTPNKTYQSMFCFLSFQANRTNKLVGFFINFSTISYSILEYFMHHSVGASPTPIANVSKQLSIKML